MKKYKEPGYIQMFLLLACSCLPILGTALVAPVLPRIQAHFADVPSVAVLVPVSLTLPALVIALLAPFVGVIVDRVGRRRTLLYSLALYGACGTVPIWLDSLTGILLSRAGLGLAEAGIMTSSMTLMGDYFKGGRREKVFGLQMVFSALSATVFIGVSGALGQDDWRVPFVLYGAGALLLPFVIACIWEAEADAEELIQTDDGEGFSWIALMPVYLLTLGAGISLLIVPVQIGFIFQSMHIDSPKIVGLAMLFNQLGVLIGALSFKYMKMRNMPRLTSLAYATAGLGGGLMVCFDSTVALTMSLFINGLGIGLMLPTSINWVMSKVSFAHRGRASGGWTSALFAGEFISPLMVLGVTVMSDSSLNFSLMIVAVVQVIIALLCLYASISTRRVVNAL